MGCAALVAGGADFKTLETELMPGAPAELLKAVAAVNGGDVENGAAVIAKLAREGNANAAFGIGYCYQTGKGVQASLGEAEKWYRIAAEAEHLGGRLALGMLTLSRSAGDTDKADEGIAWIKKAADGGQVDAQLQLGRFYANGIGVEKDAQMGRAWLTMASGAGSAEAAFELGQIAEKGDGSSEPDVKQAMRHYLKAAEGGSVRAMMYLGQGYSFGGGVIEQDLNEALKWYQKAADAGTAEAMFKAGQLYEAGGEGLKKNPAKATERFAAAAEAGLPAGQFRYGLAKVKGEGTGEDSKGGIEWLAKAAESGSADAMFQLGLLNATGQFGFPKSAAQAADWFKKAGYLGSVLGQNELAGYYLEGKGVMQDKVAAVAWYRLAAKGGLASAQVELGTMFSLGAGTEQDFGLAGFWFEKAAQQGSPVAMLKMGRLLENGLGGERNVVGAYALYLQAAEFYEEAIKDRDRLKLALTSEQISKAREAVELADKAREAAGK